MQRNTKTTSPPHTWLCLAAILCAPALSLPPSTAAAAEPAAAEVVRLGVEGRKAIAAGDHSTAARLFDQAFERYPLATFALWSARAHDRLGLRADAAARYRRAVDSAVDLGVEAKQLQARAQARAELAALLPLVPTLSVRINASSHHLTSIQIDGSDVGPPPRVHELNPGPHELRVSGPGGERVLTLRLADAEHRVIAIDPAAGDHSLLRPIGVGALIAGGVSLVGAAALTLAAANTCEGFGLTTAKCEDERTKKTHGRLRTAAITTSYLGLASALAGLLTVFVLAPAPDGPVVELSATTARLRIPF